MVRKKRTYEDDDGRTIADMSGVSRPSLFLPRRAEEDAPSPSPRPSEERPEWEQAPISREERRMYILGALKAALLIAFAFIGGLGIVILLMVLFWN